VVAYVDTSFLVSLYVQDANSARAQQIATSLREPIVVTSLQRHEARNALRLAAFLGEITRGECDALIASIDADLQSGVLREAVLPWVEVFEQAELLSSRHTGSLGTRAMDVLHVAAAVVLGVQTFYTFDARQQRFAGEVGMQVNT
jgi:hypothetical protein